MYLSYHEVTYAFPSWLLLLTWLEVPLNLDRSVIGPKSTYQVGILNLDSKFHQPNYYLALGGISFD